MNKDNLDIFRKYEIPEIVDQKEKEDIRYTKSWLSIEEIKKLFRSPLFINSRDKLLAKVMYGGGLRVSEALDSRLEDYKFEDGECYLVLYSQKTDKVNWEKTSIPDETYADVISYCSDNKIKSQDYVFQSSHKTQLSYNRAYKMIRDLSKLVGINKKITPHTFRRSRASHLLDTGIYELYDVSKFLRHKSIETTLKYLKISKKKLSEKMRAADKKIGLFN